MWRERGAGRGGAEGGWVNVQAVYNRFPTQDYDYRATQSDPSNSPPPSSALPPTLTPLLPAVRSSFHQLHVA